MWRVTYPPHHRPDDVQRHVADLARLVDRNEPFVLLYDVTKAAPLTSLERRALTDFFRARNPDIERVCIAVAFITASPMIRGVLTAIRWSVALPFELQLFSDAAAGEAWARARLARLAGRRV